MSPELTTLKVGVYLCRCRAKREELRRSEGRSPENPDQNLSQDQNLVLPVLYVPSLLDIGLKTKAQTC